MTDQFNQVAGESTRRLRLASPSQKRCVRKRIACSPLLVESGDAQRIAEEERNKQTLMSTSSIAPDPVTPPSPSAKASFVQRHGTSTAIGALAATVVFGALNLWNRHEDNAAKSSDEHIKNLIQEQLSPLATSINNHTDERIKETGVETIGTRLNDLSDRISRMEGKLNIRVSSLEQRADRQTSLASLIDPGRTLGLIQNEIQLASTTGRKIPESTLGDYRNAVLELPSDSNQYWNTVAAVINYQSFQNQLSGAAPDPLKVSKPCPIFSNSNVPGGVSFSGLRVRGCVVDLDGNTIIGMVFENSVIRYSGGQTFVEGSRFINCRFVFRLSHPNAKPQSPKLLYALLNSGDQKRFTIDSTVSNP